MSRNLLGRSWAATLGFRLFRLRLRPRPPEFVGPDLPEFGEVLVSSESTTTDLVSQVVVLWVNVDAWESVISKKSDPGALDDSAMFHGT